MVELTPADQAGISNDKPADEAWDLLLSYATEDSQWVEAIEERLSSLGLKLFDSHAIPPRFWGRSVDDLVAQIFPKQCPAAFVVLSSAYLASEQCRKELFLIVEASQSTRPSLILPVRLDESPLPELIQSIATLDARTVSVDEIVVAIKTRVQETTSKESVLDTPADFSAMERGFPFDDLREIAMKTLKFWGRNQGLGIQPGEAEEIVHEAMLSVIKHMRKGDRPYDIEYWKRVFGKQVRWKGSDYFRREAARNAELSHHFAQSLSDSQETSPLDLLERQDEIERLRKAVEELSEADREFFEARYTEDLTVSKLAGRFGISTFEAGVRLRRLISKLNRVMQVQE